jgi:hypothetical protein
MFELVTLPELYAPNIDDQGAYVDCMPSIKRGHGVRCPCGTRKEEMIYNSTEKFSSHTKTKKHQKWLKELNLNKANYYVEVLNLQELLQTQKMVIARFEKDLQNKNRTIDYLTTQLMKTTGTTIDLLTFD